MGLVGSESLPGLVGVVGVWCQVRQFLCIFLFFDLIQKYFQMEILSLMIQKNLMNPKSLMSFPIKVWTLMIPTY